MPLKIGRRPYTDCPYRWSLTVDGVSGGAGIVSEAQCTDLNGDFSLDFAPCSSKGGKLVWVGECEDPLGDVRRCVDCPNDIEVDVPSLTDGHEQNCDGTPDGTGIINSIPATTLVFRRIYGNCDRLIARASFGECDTCGYFPPGTRYELDGTIFQGNDTVYPVLPCIGSPRPQYIMELFWGQCAAGVVGGGTSPVVGYSAYYYSDDLDCDSKTFTKICQTAGDARSDADDVVWPDVIVTRGSSGTGSASGPEIHDRIRSKWHLSYNIADELWTLRSFNRIDHPIYTLSDSSPCVGETKTLVLSDRGMLADGCGVAPAEVTITRECPPDREANSGLLEDRRINGQTGKLKRHCAACDCQDEVNDPRYDCGTKCTDTSTPGCEDYTDEEAPCLYPKTTVCCDYCEGMDQPCAYIAEFECDIPDIAARQVTLRQECPFDNTCEWIAVGPSGNAADGGVGAQPVCATCSGTCPETGCTWQSWSAGPCPADNGCVESACVTYNGCWDVDVSGYAFTGLTNVTVTKTSGANWLGSAVDGDGNTVSVSLSIGAGVDCPVDIRRLDAVATSVSSA